MSVRSGQAITVDFTTQRFDTGVATAADSTPAGTLVVNGTDDAASVTVTSKTGGKYKAAVTLPTLVLNDVVQLRIAATVNSVSGIGVVWTDTKDFFAGSIPDAVAGAASGLALVGSAMTLTAGAVQAIWDAATSALTTVGSIGKWILDKLDAAITSRMATFSYTAPNNLTAAQIATGVWQDTTVGDFTVASSIGKALYTGNFVPGAANGLLISGSNAGTVTFGAFTVTGNFLISNGLSINRSSSNMSAVIINGNGTGSGVDIEGGGGANAHAVLIVANGSTADGVRITGSGGVGVRMSSETITGDYTVEGQAIFTGGINADSFTVSGLTIFNGGVDAGPFMVNGNNVDDLFTNLTAVKTRVETALPDAEPDTPDGLVTTSKVDAIQEVTDKLDTMLVLDGAVYQFTANALELAPVSGGGGLTAQQTRDAMLLAPTPGAPDIDSIDDQLSELLDELITANETADAIEERTTNIPDDPASETTAREAADGIAGVQTTVNGLGSTLSDMNEIVTAIQEVTIKVDTLLEVNGDVWRFTEASLINAPMGAGAGYGNRTISITVDDGTNPLQAATVIAKLNGVEAQRATSDVDGLATLHLDDGTYTLVILLAGYTYTPSAYDVTAYASITRSMTAISITPSSAGLCTGYLICLDVVGQPEAGVEITVAAVNGPGTAGFSLDDEPVTRTSDGDGLVEFPGLVRGGRYSVQRGALGEIRKFTIPDAATVAIDEVIGHEEGT